MLGYLLMTVGCLLHNQGRAMGWKAGVDHKFAHRMGALTATAAAYRAGQRHLL